MLQNNIFYNFSEAVSLIIYVFRKSCVSQLCATLIPRLESQVITFCWFFTANIGIEIEYDPILSWEFCQIKKVTEYIILFERFISLFSHWQCVSSFWNYSKWQGKFLFWLTINWLKCWSWPGLQITDRTRRASMTT